jgi:hypothetical protein
LVKISHAGKASTPPSAFPPGAQNGERAVATHPVILAQHSEPSVSSAALALVMPRRPSFFPPKKTRKTDPFILLGV